MAFDSPQYQEHSIETYEFVTPGRQFNFTSYRQDVVHGGVTYTAVPIGHSNYQRSLNAEEKGVSISLPVDNEFAQAVLFRTSLQGLQCRIFYQGRLNADGLTPHTEGGRFLVWHGRILSFKVTGSTMSLTLYTFLANALRQPVPKVYYQSQCNHVLYDERCRVSQMTYRRETTLQSQDGRQVTFADMYEEDWLTGGYLQRVSDGERRLITDNSENTAVIPYPLRDVEAGQQVYLFAGCDHTIGACRTKFSNQENFGGFPTVPYKNIFRTGVIG